MNKAENPPKVRLATPLDNEAIRAIYNLEVTNSTATLDMVERSEIDQSKWLDLHSGIYPALVCEINGKVAGFGSLSPYRDRPGYSGTVEDSVYVAHCARRQGVGEAILNELVNLGAAHGFHSILAMVGGGGEPSIYLHTKCGFEIVGVERQVGRKHGKWIDVTIMQRLL